MKDVVLITRPEDDATAIAYAVNQKGLLAFCEPFLDVVFHEKKIENIQEYGALVFTSANAVRAYNLYNEEKDIPVFCVGDNTQEEAQAAGFKNSKSARGGVEELTAMLSEEKSDKPFLYLRGKEITQPLVDTIPSIDIEEQIVYYTQTPEKISPNCADLLQEEAFSYIMFFSKRTAETFVSLLGKEEEGEAIQEALKRTKALCLSGSMLECLSVLPWKDIIVAKRPERQAILDLLETEGTGENE